MKIQKKWLILILSGITNAIAIAAPSMSLPVLFKEISQDLNLSLVQVGIIWGISSLPGMVTSLLGGLVADRFGPKRVVIAGVILVGITGASRGLSNSFLALMITVIMAGLLVPLISMSSFKNCSLWFPRHQLGLANGILSMGMALGFFLGSLLSATVLSPWLGGWRNVLFFYGGITVLLCIPWVLTPTQPVLPQNGPTQAPNSMIQSIRHIIRLRNTWLLGFGILGIGGCIQAALGYLPLYLRDLGWSNVSADSALSSFHLTSMIFVLPIALLSDRLGSRKRLILVMSMMIIIGIGLLSVARGPAVWASVILAGLVRDGFMAVFLTMIMETDGVGAVYAGTASGFVMIFSMLGSMIAPPLGAILAVNNPGMPFIFWGFMAVLGMVCLGLTRLPQPQIVPNAINSPVRQ